MSHKHKKVEDTWDTQFEPEIVCPYCGCVFTDSWEHSESDEDVECEDCEKHFSLDVQVDVKYSTTKNCAINEEAHNYVKTGETEDAIVEECTLCHMTRTYYPKKDKYFPPEDCDVRKVEHHFSKLLDTKDVCFEQCDKCNKRRVTDKVTKEVRIENGT